MSQPYGIVAGSDGAVWFDNLGNNSIGRITTPVTRVIRSFTPTSAAVGASVTIKGDNLAGATDVAFNGIRATITSDTATKVVTAVPAGATTGDISVTTRVGTATSDEAFDVT
jgi:streptogramin lyase